MKPGRFLSDNFKKNLYKRFIGVWLISLALLLCAQVNAAIPSFFFTLEHIQHAAFTARSVDIKLTSTPIQRLEINLGELTVREWTAHNLRFMCDRFSITRQSVDCEEGLLHISDKTLPAAFQLSLRNKQFVLVVKPGSKEKWQLTVDWYPDNWRGLLRIENGRGELLAGLMPQKENWPRLQRAKINGVISLNGQGARISELTTQLEVTELAFSDVNGLRAGEHIHLQLNVDARQKKGVWQWQGGVAWLGGEAFWQPFYFTGEGHHLTISGKIHEESLSVDQGVLTLSNIGQVDFSGKVDIPTQKLRQAELQAEILEMAALFESIIQPLAADTALAETRAKGKADIAWRYRGEENQSLTIDLHNVSLADARDRFSFEGLYAHLPWQSAERSTGTIRLGSGKILQIPLGAMQIPLETIGMDFSVRYAEMPVLDGKVVIENFNASLQESDWQWQFNGRLFPVSMEKLTEALQTQPMFGTLSGIIPRMNYAASIMTMEGVLVFNIFDGVAVARNLKLIEPLSRTPHLTMDMAMHHIDLDLLTRAYSFGRIQGRIDVEVNDLELVNWEPVRFDAKLVSSPGKYKRRISQAAIQNLTALGGESAMTAIQLSFLRLFEQFRYSEIGWRCKLRGNICQMGGVEPLPNDEQGYVLVKGSGVPGITITGYNREVDWLELVKRLENAIKSGSPIIH
jgi:hypothetical protein